MSKQDDNESFILILEHLKSLDENVSSLNTAIFKGNGSPSLLSQIQKNTTVVKIIVFMVSVIYIAAITGGVTYMCNKISHNNNTTNQVHSITNSI